jgi:AraC family transcriptional regulator
MPPIVQAFANIENMEPPHFEDRQSFLLAGLTERYKMPQIEGIPAQWHRFAPHIGKVPGQIGTTTYGVCFNFDAAGGMDYMCGVEIAEGSPLPVGLTQLRIEAQRYAVFHHRDHISTIKKTWDSIFQQWLPGSGHTIAKAPQLETYGDDFNAQTGTGVVAIWIPLS